MLGITAKAVSKWERGVAYPDTATIPAIAEIF
jgi:transcriptional regulator with XRE-family HTH domain